MLRRTVAVAEVDGHGPALAALDGLDRYHLFHAIARTGNAPNASSCEAG